VENAGEVVINYVEKDGQAAQISALNVDDLDKKFEFISKRYQQKIITGHNVTNPELFGIKTEGQLGTRVSLNDSYELFLNTYTKPRQKVLADFIEELIFLKSGIDIQLEFKELKPIGLDLSNDQDLTVDERRELKGYKPLTAPKVDATGQPVQVEAGNDALRGLSASENADLYRIIRDYNKGKINEVLALTRVKAYGLTEAEAKSILGIEEEAPQQFSAQDVEAKILARFDELAEDLNFEFEVLLDEEVHLHSSKDALQYELKASRMAFETVITVTDLDNAVLNALKGNPTLTIEELAKMTGKTYLDIVQSLNRLKEKALLIDSAKGLTPTDKAIKKETEPVTESEIRTVYYYKLADDSPRTNKEGKPIKSRKFCSDMLAKTSKSKAWTFEKIDSMNNEFGMNVWSYRGGFYTNSDTGETTPFCRHVWAAKTIRIIKKK
jgi:hypothetical protein